MDLNEKIMQRRRELEQEASSIRAQSLVKDSERNEKIKEQARRQLVEDGILNNDNQKDIEREKEKIIDEMVQSRWTNTENNKLVFLIIMTVVGFFIKWQIGLLFVVVILIYVNIVNGQHKKKILSETKSNNFDGC